MNARAGYFGFVSLSSGLVPLTRLPVGLTSAILTSPVSHLLWCVCKKLASWALAFFATLSGLVEFSRVVLDLGFQKGVRVSVLWPGVHGVLGF